MGVQPSCSAPLCTASAAPALPRARSRRPRTLQVSLPDATKQVFGYCDAADASASGSIVPGGELRLGEAVDPCEGVGDFFVGLTYSASLYAVLPALVIVMALVNKYNLAVTVGTAIAAAATTS